MQKNLEEMNNEFYYPRHFGNYYDYLEDDYSEYKDINQFIPRIEGTQLELGIAFLNSNYLPILTSRKQDNRVKYYLFDVIKIWQKKLDEDENAE